MNIIHKEATSTFLNFSAMSATKSFFHSARGKHFLLICPCFLLLQSSLQVTVIQTDLSLQCQELPWTTEMLSSICSYIHACNQAKQANKQTNPPKKQQKTKTTKNPPKPPPPKKTPKKPRAALILGSFANTTEIWASCVQMLL